LVEAGCWKGGSSAKFSIACKLLGYRLHVFDSFEGVPPLTEQEKQTSYDFSFEYAATESEVRANIQRFGEIDWCITHRGLFRDTFRNPAIDELVGVLYVDCDTLQGTREVIEGVAPKLTTASILFSQDCHIPVIADYFERVETWDSLGLPGARVQRHCGSLSSVRFGPTIGEAKERS
jgi:O-methyltransferase